MTWIEALKGFARSRLARKNSPDKLFQYFYKAELQAEKDQIWMRKRGYKVQVSLETFANVYSLIKDIPADDSRKLSLRPVFHFDVPRVLLGRDFADTIRCNANWLEIIEDKND